MRLPNYPYRVALAAPCWTDATLLEILRSLLSGGVIRGPSLSRLRFQVIRHLGVADALLCGSGSLALEIALRASGVRRGAEVVIPAFCCTAVVPPILAAGALPVFADVGKELNLTPENVEAVLTEKTGAIIVPHLFGNPADIRGIVQLASGRRIRVIDDAAQALGATADGGPAGGFGDAGILSFGREKVCFGLGGGVVVSRHKGHFDAFAKELSPPRLSTALGTLSSTLVRRRWRRWTFPLEALLCRAEGGPDSPPPLYSKAAMANLAAAVASSLLETLRDNIAARQTRVRAYRELLGSEERLELIPHRSGSACLAQVTRLLPKHRADDPATRAIRALGRAGYEVQGSYVPIHLLDSYRSWVRRSLPFTDKVWPDLVELPCEPQVSLDQVERIAAIVKNVLDT